MYKKLNVSVRERILFLFTGLLDSKHLIANVSDKPVNQKVTERTSDINTTEEDVLKMDIPFFELDTSETKSNLSNPER